MKSISFGRDKTQILKGIALILMIIHHTVNPGYWAEEGSVLYQVLDKIGAATKICVWIFAFLVGYGYYCSKNKTLKYSIKRILLLVIPFWMMLFLLFIPLAYASGNLYETLTSGGGNWLVGLIYNMFGCVETLNWYSWFVGVYCISILFMPLLDKLFQKYPKYGWITAILVFYAAAVLLHFIPGWADMPLVSMLFTTFRIIAIIIVGYMCAMWNEQGKIPRWFEGKSRLLLSILAICAVLLIQAANIPSAGFCIQAFYTPIFVFAIVGICNSFDSKWLKSALSKVGDLSMYMWFFHAIFFTESVNLYTKNLVFEPFHTWAYTFVMTFVLTYLGSWGIQAALSPIIKRIK